MKRVRDELSIRTPTRRGETKGGSTIRPVTISPKNDRDVPLKAEKAKCNRTGLGTTHYFPFPLLLWRERRRMMYKLQRSPSYEKAHYFTFLICLCLDPFPN